MLALLGCDSETDHTPDAGLVRDAALVDGGALLDAGIGADGAQDSGAEADAGASAFCSLGACDPSVPDCSGGSCVLWSEASSCEPSGGRYPADTPCEDVSDCAPGFACFAAPGGGGVCGRVCCPLDPDDCVGDDAVCGGAGVLVDGTPTSWGQCLPRRTCDVLAPEESCVSREGCYIVDVSGATECRVAGSRGAGEPCVAQQDCQPTFFCGAGAHCVRICRLGAGECPPGEGRCVAQVHSPEGTGICTQS